MPCVDGHKCNKKTNASITIQATVSTSMFVWSLEGILFFFNPRAPYLGSWTYDVNFRVIIGTYPVLLFHMSLMWSLGLVKKKNAHIDF